MHAKLGLVPVALVFCLVGVSPAQNMDELMRINAIVLEAPIYPDARACPPQSSGSRWPRSPAAPTS